MGTADQGSELHMRMMRACARASAWRARGLVPSSHAPFVERRAGGRPPLWTPLAVESQPSGLSGLSGPYSHAPMLAESAFLLKTRVLCPAAASRVFFRPPNKHIYFKMYSINDKSACFI